MQLLNSLLLLLSCDGTIMIIITALITMITTESLTMSAAVAVLFAPHVEIHIHRCQQDDHHQGDHHRQDGDHKVDRR